MSMQSDLRNPELGYYDEGMNLTDASVYAKACLPFGEATMLPPVAYRSKAFLELENEKVWTRSWVVIGLLQQIPRPGDLLPLTLGFHGIHVQRNADGTISARMNRHQHGGCRFVPEQCRTGVQTKCSITSCNYTRDADVMPGGDDGENTDLMYKFVGLVPERLAPVKCETWGPFIFVNLDPACAPLAEYLGDLPDVLGPELDQSLKLTGKLWLDFQCNWKIAGAAFTGLDQPPSIRNLSRGSDEVGSYAEATAMPAGLPPDLRIFWLFPNVLLAVGRGQMAVVLLQMTGMGKSLYRFFHLTAEPTAPGSSFDQWVSFLKSNGAMAEAMHDDAALQGTSHRPGTGQDDMLVERSTCSYSLNQFLVSKLIAQHHHYWSAPIMDGAMLMRSSRR